MVDATLAGLIGGFAGAVAMMISMQVMMEGPSPTQVMASKIKGTPPEENKGLGAILHFFYGTVVGLVLAVLVDAFLDPVATYETATYTLIGVAWSLLLWIGSFFWMGVLGLAKEMMQKPMGERVKQMGGMFGMHLLYGAVTGVVTILLV